MTERELYDLLEIDKAPGSEIVMPLKSTHIIIDSCPDFDDTLIGKN